MLSRTLRRHVAATPPPRTPNAAMKTGAFVAYLVWQLVLTECAREIQLGENSHSPSNIQLLIPVLVSGPKHASNEIDKGMPFSSIPSSAFILDKALSGLPAKRGQVNSYQLDDAPRPRSLYLDSTESGEQSALDAELWRARSRLLRSAARAPELLLALCTELLDRPAPPARPACSCRAPARPQPARRDLMPVGGNSEWVLRYMRSSGKRPRPSMSKWNDE